MSWELFDKRKPPATAEPRVTIQKNGIMTFNAASCSALGDPTVINLFYDSERRRVGFRKAKETEATAYQFRKQGNTTTFNISGQKFCRYYGLSLSHSRRYAATVEDGMLAIDLDSPTEEFK